MFSVHDFYSQTHAKWILAGEHAVLRGHSALVFPLHAKKMTLQYQDNGSALSADFGGEQGSDLHLLFWSVIEHGLKHVQRDLSHVTGHFVLSNNIPIGSGLGASAALCLNIGRWFAWKQWISAENLFDFSKYLEDLFHGKSSGLDLAGSLYDAGTYFSPKSDYPLIEPIVPTWKPYWYLSFTGQIGITSHCVRKVEQLHQENSELAKQLDHDMEKAVQLARKALEINADDTDYPNRLNLLFNAIQQAKQCFSMWGLVSSTIEKHMNELKSAGAIACKPTGSGEGGYVLSLWKEPAPVNTLPMKLIKIDI